MARDKRDETAIVTTTVRIPRHVWALLRQLAEERADQLGGRPSVSGVVCEMAEARSKDARRRA